MFSTNMPEIYKEKRSNGRWKQALLLNDARGQSPGYRPRMRSEVFSQLAVAEAATLLPKMARGRLSTLKQFSLTACVGLISLFTLCNIIGIVLLQKHRLALRHDTFLSLPFGDQLRTRRKFISLSSMLHNHSFNFNLSTTIIDSHYGLYRHQSFFLKGLSWEDSVEKTSVTLATQTSIDRLDVLLELAEYWKFPISISVFTPGIEFQIAKIFIAFLRRCSDTILHNTTFHLVFPHQNPPEEDYTIQKVQVFECSQSSDFLRGLLRIRADTFVAWRNRTLFPQNHMRNIARSHVETPYTFLTDIEIIPSHTLTSLLPDFLRDQSTRQCGKCAFVVPTYEIPSVESVPSTKKELLKMVRSKKTQPFHYKVFIYNQFLTNHSLWESLPIPDHMETPYSINYEFYYEPFYIAGNDIPMYDERFIGYGFTRNTQIEEEREKVRGPPWEQLVSRPPRDLTEFMRRFVTKNETWVHYYTPEIKQQSKQWVEAIGLAPKKAESIVSAGKVMASVFWDTKEILLIDYLEKAKLSQLDVKFHEKRPSFKKKNHLSTKYVGIFSAIPYSSDLAPSEFYQGHLRSVKRLSAGLRAPFRRFESRLIPANSAAQTAVHRGRLSAPR
ncbi:B3GNT1 [Cordylochernes scorpioides]|uniref:Beta-1,4-glucuronyltransferase 1 n=1 Tax=Cordylochernes scorpioides TaxID=51811 RepID=A0ABY6JXF8_9ARAC|nr:B3GNT1 [Cordylochernes scorpioides]